MIRLVEALHYRCLRYVRQPLDDFQVLVGPNASGKSTFLDVLPGAWIVGANRTCRSLVREAYS